MCALPNTNIGLQDFHGSCMVIQIQQNQISSLISKLYVTMIEKRFPLELQLLLVMYYEQNVFTQNPK